MLFKDTFCGHLKSPNYIYCINLAVIMMFLCPGNGQALGQCMLSIVALN